MTHLIDPEQIIVTMPPGSAVYARTYRPEPHTDFMIREASKVIKKLHNPMVQLRAGMLEQDGIYLVCVMFWIGSHRDQLFETWWNFHQTGEGEKHFKDMVIQDDIAIFMYGDEKTREKNIKVNNSLKDFFGEVLEKVREMPAWRMKDFDRAREKLYKQYPSPEHLWKALAILRS